MKKILITICMILCSCLWASAQNYQEVIYLKNGSIIKGVIIEQTPNVSLKIKTADGSIFAYQMSEVEKITKEEINDTQRNYRFNNPNSSFKTDRVGYRGFVELGGIIGTGDYGDGAFSFSTTHGYQFSPYFFIGAGIGADYHFDWGTVFIPIFADARAYFIDGRVSPFIGIKAGYSVFDGTGVYFNPNVGVSCALSPKLGLNLALGYSLQRAEVSYYNYGYNYPRYSYSNETIGGVTIKVGLEF